MVDEVAGSASIEVRATVEALRADMRRIERITADGARSMQAQANRTERALGNVGARFRRDMALTSSSVRAVNSDLASLGRLSTAALAGAGGAAGAVAVVRLADEYTNLSSRLRLVLKDGEDFNDVQERLYQIAQRNRAAIADITNLYVRLRQSIAGLGDVEASNIATVLSQTLAISGASASETASFLRQISQALASGVLRGDEFNSVMENNSRFAALLADQLGVSVGQLRAMAEQGRLTADVIRSAIAGGAGDLNAEFERMPLTIAGAYTQIENAFKRYIGQTDQGLGASQRMAQGLSLLAKNFEQVADAMIIVGAASVANLGGRGLNAAGVAALTSMATAAAEAKAPQDAAIAALTRANTRSKLLQGQVRTRLDMVRGIEAEIEKIQAGIARRNEYFATNSPYSGADRAAVAKALNQNDGLNLSPTDPRVMARARAQVDTINANEMARAAALRAQLEGANKKLLQSETQLTNATNRQAAATSTLTQGATLLGKAKTGAATAGNLLRNSLGGLVNLAGGPLPAAITAAAVAFFLITRRQDEARQAAARMTDALSIIANATPAFEGASVTIGETADETRTLAEVIEDAALGTKDAADEMDRYAGKLKGSATATDIQARATRALANARMEEAKATLRQAIAEGERARNYLPSQIASMESAAGEVRGRLRTAQSYPVDLVGNRADVVRDLQADVARREREIADQRRLLADLERSLPINREGLAALESGLLNLGAPAEDAATNTVTVGGGSRSIADLERAAQLSLARLRNEQERVAALEDAAEIDQRADAYVTAGVAAAEARAKAEGEVTAERAEHNRLQGEGLEMASLQDRIDLAREDGMIRTAEALEDELEIRRRITDLMSQGLSLTEATARASDYVNGRRRIANENRSRELRDRDLDRRLELAEARGDGPETRRLSREQEYRRRQAELEGYGYGRDEAAGMADREMHDLSRAEMWGDVREGLSGALVAAIRNEDWKAALGDALERRATEALENAFDAAVNLLAELLKNVRVGGSNGDGGWVSTAISAVASIFGGGRALGGDVSGKMAYGINEMGQEVFFPGISGSVATNKALRDSFGGGGGKGVTVNNHFHLNGAVTSSELRAEMAQMGAAAVQAARQGAAADRQRSAFTKLR